METTTKSKQTALEVIHQQLIDAVDQLITGEDWLAFLAMASRFYRYSLNNVLLIMRQMPTAIQVASYTTWQSLSRQVRKGEHGVKILTPCRYRKLADDIGTDSNSEEYVVRGFRVTSVFEVSQTDVEALPTVEVPKLLEGEAPEGMWDDLVALIVGAGFTVKRGDVGIANGITRYLTKEVLIASHLSDRAAAKTLCHELAHVRMHGDVLNTRSRDAIEVEAESVAYLVVHAWGMNTTDYSIPYVAHWAQNTDLVKETMQRVVSAAREIISACHFDCVSSSARG